MLCGPLVYTDLAVEPKWSDAGEWWRSDKVCGTAEASPCLINTCFSFFPSLCPGHITWHIVLSVSRIVTSTRFRQTLPGESRSLVLCYVFGATVSEVKAGPRQPEALWASRAATRAWSLAGEHTRPTAWNWVCISSANHSAAQTQEEETGERAWFGPEMWPLGLLAEPEWFHFLKVKWCSLEIKHNEVV